MRQVPQYLIVGNGRVARHVCHYFSLLNIPVLTWNRSESFDLLHEKIQQVSHILLLISDGAIDSFIAAHLNHTSAICIHFSGSLFTEKAYGAHPLMTFSNAFYSLEQYQSIPFVIDENAPALFSELPNPQVRLSSHLKARYHALCVLAGNFSCLLWQKLFSDFKDVLHLSPGIAHPFLKQQMQNLIDQPEKALTGPLVRGDHMTLKKNIDALDGDPFQAIYNSFITCYHKMKETK